MHTSSLRTPLLIAAVSLIAAGCSQTRGTPMVESRKQGSLNALSMDQIGTFHLTGSEVRNVNAFRVSDSTVVAATWEEQTGGQWSPFFAISLNGQKISTVRQTSSDLLLRQGKFDPLAQPAGAVSEPLSDVRIVQFNTLVLTEYRSQLEAAGARIYRYLPNNALIVEAPAFVASEISKQPQVRWVGPYRPEYKFDPSLLANLLGNKGGAPARYHLELFERGLALQSLVGERVEEIGGRVEVKRPLGFFMDATLSPEQVLQISLLPEVAYIDEWSPGEADDVQVRAIGGADYLENQTGFTGQGVRAEVLDVGVLPGHQEFAATPLIPHGPQSVAGHGTSTTGINFASGVEPRARGLVPDGQGISAFQGSLRDRYQHTAELVQDPYFAVYQSNSWGGNLTTQYTIDSAHMDDIIFLDDILITQSQSNAGTQQSRPEAWAKNIVSIGGVRHCNPTCTTDMSLMQWGHSGSIGPAADGRIKPDLAHFYDGVYAPGTPSPTSYDTSFGGTSAATPIVAGHFGLFFQMWHNGLFGNPTSDTVFNSRPHQSTARAFMINTATQWNFTGTTADLTRTHQGWGMPNVQSLYDLSTQTLWVNETDVLQQLQSTTYTLEVLDGTPALKATMVYKDPMGTTSSTLHRINDLDLQVTSPSGIVYWGNNGLREGLWSTEGGDPDPLDTVENVFVQNPEVGLWSVTVIAREINQDSHPETPEIDADYALVVSGINVPTARALKSQL